MSEFKLLTDEQIEQLRLAFRKLGEIINNTFQNPQFIKLIKQYNPELFETNNSRRRRHLPTRRRNNKWN